MEYNSDELYESKLCAFREDAMGGIEGMTAVVWSILNRAKRHKYSIHEAITTAWAYSSMVAPGMGNEPSKTHAVLINTQEEINRLYKKINVMNSMMKSLSSYVHLDHVSELAAWKNAEMIVKNVYAETPGIVDPTGGATLYYSRLMMSDPPYWAKDTTKTAFTVEIGGQRYYKEFA